jgi:hypothetical protein
MQDLCHMINYCSAILKEMIAYTEKFTQKHDFFWSDRGYRHSGPSTYGAD